MRSLFAFTASGSGLASRLLLALTAVSMLGAASFSVQAENNAPPVVETYSDVTATADTANGVAEVTEGTYEAMYEDGTDGHARLRHFLVADDGQRHELHLKQDVPSVATGAKVRVHGRQQDDGSITQQEGSILTLAAGATTDGGSNGGTPSVLANTTGEQRTLVLMANFQENPAEQPLTVEQARALVLGQVSDFFYENSYQQTTLAGDVYGWFNLPVSNTICNLNAAGNAADQAAIAAGVNLSSYTRIVYLFTKTSCAASGMGTVGGQPSRSYINGNLTAKTIAHELGHNFGLYHSHALDCNGVTLGNTCTSIEYGDTNDTMGNPDIGHFNAFQKSRLGWLGQSDSLPVTAVTADGSYVMGVYESATSETKAVKIPRGINPLTGNQTWFYVEYRQAVGFDSFLSTRPYAQNVTNGVIVHLVEDNVPNSSELLHMNPDSYFFSIFGHDNWFDPALRVGQSFTDPVSGVTISTDWADAASASITVHLGSQTCVQTKPALTITPLQSGSVTAGASVSYDVTVSNQDSSQCSAATINLSSVLPSGWTGSFDTASLQLSPGAIGKAHLTVSSTSTAVEGSYTINVTAANGGATNTASTSYSVIKANLPPVAVNDIVSMTSIGAVTIPALANDYDPEGSVITVVAFGQGSKGSVSLNSDGTITYVPAKSFKGSDSFTYTISDGQTTATANVTISLVTISGSKTTGRK